MAIVFYSIIQLALILGNRLPAKGEGMDCEQLVTRAQKGDQKAFEQLILDFQPLVQKYAKLSYLRSIQEDAMAEANLALTEAVKNFDPKVNNSFAGYAKACVRYRLWNYFKHERKKWNAEYLVLDDAEYYKEIADPRDFVDSVIVENLTGIFKKSLGYGLESLTDKQRFIIEKCILQNMPLGYAAKTLGITPQAACRIKKRALKALRRKLLVLLDG